MTILLLAVQNDQWESNLMNNKPNKVNYFTRNWTPNRTIDEVHFVKDGKVIMKGDFLNAEKLKSKDVYRKYGNLTNGLNSTDNYNDFLNLTKYVLSQNYMLGNIVVDNVQYNPQGFQVSYIAKTNQRGRYI